MNKALNGLRYVTAVSISISLATGSWADEPIKNRLSLSARSGFNISARFNSVASSGPNFTPANNQITPDGDHYNYDNGYVGGVGGLQPDNSGNIGNETWYWGYNDASQIVGNTIYFTRTTATNWESAPASLIKDNLQPGSEMVYNHSLGGSGRAHYGIELAANYLNINLSNFAIIGSSHSRITDGFSFDVLFPPPPPYQGTVNGPGPLIGDQIISQAIEVFHGPKFFEQKKIKGTLWGTRLGPYQEFQLGRRVNIAFSGGLAIGLLDAHVSRTQNINNFLTVNGSSDLAMLWGGYLGTTIAYKLTDNWNFGLNGQYQDLGIYKKRFGMDEATLDLSRSLFLTVGIGYSC
jgi:hypothetical protein